MSYVQGTDRGQAALLPAAIEDYVGADAPVRVIDAFVDGLNVSELGFGRSVPAATGRPAYDPRDLLKLYIWGYFNEVRSSRRLERECRRNVEVMWLLRRLSPDFKTIADFRRDNGVAIVGGVQLRQRQLKNLRFPTSYVKLVEVFRAYGGISGTAPGEVSSCGTASSIKTAGSLRSLFDDASWCSAIWRRRSSHRLSVWLRSERISFNRPSSCRHALI